MAEPYLGQIITVGFNFAPLNWMQCSGQLLPISTYDALFAVLGTTYGGDGQTSFALPNLNGRVPIGQGQGRGLQPYIVGQTVGTEEVTLIGANSPAHNHTVSFTNLSGTTESPKPISGANVAMGTNVGSGVPAFYVSGGTGTVSLNAGTITPSGTGTLPHENRQPYVAVNYIICVVGIFPPRS